MSAGSDKDNTSNAADGVDRGCSAETKAATPEELVWLRMFSPATHGLEVPRELGRQMEKRGFLTWVPPLFGCNHLYAITDAGRAVVAKTQPPAKAGEAKQ